MATRSIRGRSIITKINLLKAKRSCSNPPKSRMKYFLALLLLDSYIFELRGIIYREDDISPYHTKALENRITTTEPVFYLMCAS